MTPTEALRDKWRRSPDFVAAEQDLRPLLDFAAHMLRLRLRQGLSQQQLAELAGTKQANISRVEAGLANPTLAALQRIASALDADLVISLQPRSAQAEPSQADAEGEADGPVLIINYPARPDRPSATASATISRSARRRGGQRRAFR